MDNNTNTEESSLITDNAYYVAIILSKKIFVISFTFIVTLAVGISAFVFLPNMYKSTINLVPPKTSTNGIEGALSGVSSALKDFGLSKMGGGASGDDYSFIVILESREVVDSIIKKHNLAKVYKYPDTLMSKVRKEFEENREITFEKDGNYFISIWDVDKQRAADIANEYADIANGVAIRLFQEEASFNLKYMDSRVKIIDSALNVVSKKLEAYSKDKMIFSPTDQSKSLSLALAELKSQVIVYEISYDMAKNKYGENDPNTQNYKQLILQTKAQLSKAENEPGFAGNFSVKDASGVGLNFAKLFTEFETLSKVKAFLIPTIEKQRIDINRNIRSVLIVDKAIVADLKDKPKRSLLVLGAFLGSFILSILLVFIYHNLKMFRKKINQISINK